MAANKKPSNRKPLPDPLAFKETRKETKARIAEERAASAKRLETQRAQEHRTRMQEQQRFVENKWQNYRSAGQGSKTYNQWRQAAENAAAKDFQTQIGTRKIDIVRSPKQSSAIDRIMLNAPGPKTTASPAPGRGPKKDTLRGLTHEAGTKSLLKGMLKFFQ